MDAIGFIYAWQKLYSVLVFRSVVSTPFYISHLIVERISAPFLHNRAFCEESTTLTECIDVYTSMNIKYGAICQINAESKKIKISDILI